MRRLLHFLLISFTFWHVNEAFGQDSYQPINFENGRWVFIANQKGPFWGSSYEIDTLLYYFKGDTLIENNLYKKLYFSGRSYKQPIGSSEIEIVNRYSGAFKDDTLNKTVWYNGRLIYDYNLAINDTIKNGEYIGQIVGSIDSVQYCNKYYKRFTFVDSQNWPPLIENIRVLDVVRMVYDGITGYCKLACYYEANNKDCQACDVTVGLKNRNIQDYKIYPNPTDGKITFKCGEGQKSVLIYNSSGNQVSKLIDISNNNTIDISDYCPGIYTFRIVRTGQTYNLKIVKK
jgi:hypothetical protein